MKNSIEKILYSFEFKHIAIRFSIGLLIDAFLYGYKKQDYNLPNATLISFSLPVSVPILTCYFVGRALSYYLEE